VFFLFMDAFCLNYIMQTQGMQAKKQEKKLFFGSSTVSDRENMG